MAHFLIRYWDRVLFLCLILAFLGLLLWGWIDYENTAARRTEAQYHCTDE